jgi:dihydropteroate synthase
VEAGVEFTAVGLPQVMGPLDQPPTAASAGDAVVDVGRSLKPGGWAGSRILFLTGKLAEPLVRRTVDELAARLGFVPTVEVLGITVAALMHVHWVLRKLRVEAGRFDLILAPGWIQGDLDALSAACGVPVRAGPKDVRDLPEYFGLSAKAAVDLTTYDIEIVAEINHAPRLSDAELMRAALAYRGDGADVIDLGCIPGERWAGVAAAVARLKDGGLRVSIDSFERDEVESAVAAGAELVLSCNATNRDWAAELPAELVAIPDDPSRLDTLDDTVAHLQSRGARFRLDPILEPMGYGFAESLVRYRTTRLKYPNERLLMGIGNVTELAQVDSAGLHLLLAVVCQEWGITSVLTTAVAPWCRSAVREFDLARRLAAFALRRQSLIKGFEPSLLMLRDRRVEEPAESWLTHLAASITDPNVRVFVSGGQVHLVNRDGHWQGDDPYEVFDRFAAAVPGLDTTHAFYLGYELAKAATALTLGKRYTQDEALDWGLLTRPEVSALHRRRESQDQKPCD